MALESQSNNILELYFTCSNEKLQTKNVEQKFFKIINIKLLEIYF